MKIIIMPTIYIVTGGKWTGDIGHILHPGGYICLFIHPHQMLLMSFPRNVVVSGQRENLWEYDI
jgi:hypothetical protein